jgi:hypothetical protein
MSYKKVLLLWYMVHNPLSQSTYKHVLELVLAWYLIYILSYSLSSNPARI